MEEFNDLNKVEMDLDDSINKKNKNIIENNEKKLNTNIKEKKKFVYILFFVLSLVKEFHLLFLIMYFRIQKKDWDEYYSLIFFLIFLYDIIFGIIMKITECFISHKIILLLSICVPAVFLKMIISSFFHIIPFFDDEMIININKGEVLARIIILFFTPYPTNQFLTNSNLTVLIIFIIISIISFFSIILYYYKLEDLKKEEESNTLIKYEYFSNNFILNYLLFINYSITFSTVPFLILKIFGKKFLIVFIIGDIIGRYLSFLTTCINEAHYKPIIFFRFFYCIYLNFTFDNEQISGLIHSFLLGILSGTLTFVGYCIPVRKKKKNEKISLLHYLKLGKYYVLSMIGDKKNE